MLRAFIGILLVVAGTAAAILWRSRPASERSVKARLTQLSSDGSFYAEPSISHDGNWLAYASDRGGDGAFAVCLTVVAAPNFLLKYSVNSWVSASVRLAPQPTILSISRFHPAADNRCSSMRGMP